MQTWANSPQFDTPAHHRLIYGEFFKFEYLMLRNRQRLKLRKAAVISLEESRRVIDKVVARLPFQLTQGQIRVIDDILNDIAIDTRKMFFATKDLDSGAQEYFPSVYTGIDQVAFGQCSSGPPMNRLLQGDVGAGKTVIAFLSAACAMASGWQAVLMAPTEILATQHYLGAIRLFGKRDAEQGSLFQLESDPQFEVALLTGRTPAHERGRIRDRLREGAPLLLIGTHALLEDWVVFKNLFLVMIDEQHRFGVEQRKTLKDKGSPTRFFFWGGASSSLIDLNGDANS
jgi:ATP-dependent DNA helicase RecG